MASPRGFEFGSVSGIRGSPVPLENLAVTGTESFAMCGARVREDASAAGAHMPVSIAPLAWTGRKPGCKPNSVSICFNKSLASWIIFSSGGRGMVPVRFLPLRIVTQTALTDHDFAWELRVILKESFLPL